MIKVFYTTGRTEGKKKKVDVIYGYQIGGLGFMRSRDPATLLPGDTSKNVQKAACPDLITICKNEGGAETAILHGNLNIKNLNIKNVWVAVL